MPAELQVMLDEADALERSFERLSPDPVRLAAELDAGTRELARLKAEIRALDGPSRHRASLFVTSMVMAAVAALAIAAWLMQGGLL